MAKTKKKLLVISDDYENVFTKEIILERLKEANYFYNDETNWLCFDVTMVDCFFKLFNREGKQIAPIDADLIVIDFGLISYGQWEKECVERLSKKCSLLMLTSQTPHYVKEEVEENEYYRQFPIVDASVEGMIHDIYINCEKAGLKEKWRE